MKNIMIIISVATVSMVVGYLIGNSGHSAASASHEKELHEVKTTINVPQRKESVNTQQLELAVSSKESLSEACIRPQILDIDDFDVALGFYYRGDKGYNQLYQELKSNMMLPVHRPSTKLVVAVVKGEEELEYPTITVENIDENIELYSEALTQKAINKMESDSVKKFGAYSPEMENTVSEWIYENMQDEFIGVSQIICRERLCSVFAPIQEGETIRSVRKQLKVKGKHLQSQLGYKGVYLGAELNPSTNEAIMTLTFHHERQKTGREIIQEMMDANRKNRL